MNEPTIEASIAWQKFRIGRLQTKLCEPTEIAQEEAILASLERLKSLDAQPRPEFFNDKSVINSIADAQAVPVEPEHIKILSTGFEHVKNYNYPEKVYQLTKEATK